jgi:hypothetical protein
MAPLSLFLLRILTETALHRRHIPLSQIQMCKPSGLQAKMVIDVPESTVRCSTIAFSRVSTALHEHLCNHIGLRIYDASRCRSHPTVGQIMQLPRRANHNGHVQCRSSNSPRVSYLQLPNRVQHPAWRHDESATSPQPRELDERHCHGRKELHRYRLGCDNMK